MFINQKKHTVQKQEETSSDMSSNTNQSSASPNQQHMAHLEHILGAATSATIKQARNYFIGSNPTDKQSEEVTGGGTSNNPPRTGTEDLGQCRKWGERANQKVSAPDRQQSSPIKGRISI